jgi:hypothetical protein
VKKSKNGGMGAATPFGPKKVPGTGGYLKIEEVQE